jgi:hypothetical protein
MESDMEMKTYSNIQTNYALGSEIPENLEEPLLLIIDNNIPDGTVHLFRRMISQGRMSHGLHEMYWRGLIS